jgi:hypothetical protein
LSPAARGGWSGGCELEHEHEENRAEAQEVVGQDRAGESRLPGGVVGLATEPYRVRYGPPPGEADRGGVSSGASDALQRKVVAEELRGGAAMVTTCR